MKRGVIVFILFLIRGTIFSQGSWEPEGADLSFPRTLLDSTSIDEIRLTLNETINLDLYRLIWENANSSIPSGDTLDGERFSRSLIAREEAFCILMNRKWERDSITTLSAVERDSLTARCIRLLKEMNTNVGFQQGWVFYQEWQNRSKELINYLVAYDLLRGAGISAGSLQQARDSLTSFTAHLYHRAMAVYTVDIFQLRFFQFQVNNHSIMTASALGLAAVLLNNHESSNPDYQPLNWINAGLWNLDNTLWIENGLYPRVSEPDRIAGYAEGPGYFDYSFQNAFPFIRALWNFLPDEMIPVIFDQLPRQVRNPWYDPRYDRLYDWINRLRLPDGSLPAIHDCPIGFTTTITSLCGKAAFNLPFPNRSYESPFIRTQFIATHPPQGVNIDSLFQSLPDAGSLIFRSSWEPDAIYMHFIGKHGISLTGAKSHHQGDASSFELMAFGQLLAVDPGYPGAPQSDIVNKAVNHNLVLVNWNGPLPPNGEYVNTVSNTSYIENTFHIPGFDYGEIRTSYSGASVVRSNIFLHDRYFILTDLPRSTASQDYTFQFHGNGLNGSSPVSPEGAFDPVFDHLSGIYTRDSVKLLVQTQAENGASSYSFELDSLASGYETYRHYSKMLVTRANVTNTSFQTILFPFKSLVPDLTPITGLTDLNATVIHEDLITDIVFSQSATGMKQITASQSSLNTTVSGNGKVNLISFDQDNRARIVFLRDGDSLLAGSQILIAANHSLVIGWKELKPGFLEGYCSGAGIVAIFSKIPLQVVQGNISAVTWDPGNKLNLLQVTGKGNFRLEPVNGISEKSDIPIIEIKIIPNPSSTGLFMLNVISQKKIYADIVLFTPSGQFLFNKHIIFDQGAQSQTIDLSGFPSGTYILKISGEKFKQNLTLISL